MPSCYFQVFVGFLFFCLATVPLSKSNAQAAQTTQVSTVKVFILAGQSNMAGHGVVDLDDEKDYNAGKGILANVIKAPKNIQRMAHLKNADGTWAVREDAFCWYQTNESLKSGGISIGFSAYQGDPHHFGPEMQFGHVVGDAFDEPVLLIKTAWGGKSLYADFRPPSSGGTVGPFYEKMLGQIQTALKDAENKIPALKGKQFEMSGFVWQQGWNDMIDDAATSEYAANLKNLITDIRQALGKPDLPFVFGELGNGGEAKGEKMQRFRKAQADVAAMKIRNVAFVKTSQFARRAEDSPNQGHGHHWFGNAESYFLVGDSLGQAMLKLTQLDDRKRILLIGDSISIGYHKHVQQMLPAALVTRPMRNEKAAENCQGTDSGIKNIDRWLEIEGGHWDVIHFNFGLHDLKHVNAETGKNSNDANDPLQSTPQEYETQLREIVKKLKQTGATLVFCTTTPVPEGCKPLRETTAPQVFNAIGKKIAQENDIAINDLYAFALPKLAEIQRPANVHFSNEGSAVLAEQVTREIRQALKTAVEK
jgi:lysophospholipase L1-like esterase